jgi:predicted ATPase
MDNDFQALKQLILDKTQGTPFFMEEIVQELREQGLLTDLRRVGAAHQYLDLHLPTTVQAVLAARIDRLAPDEKALLQQLSVIGRQFPLSLIRQVIAQPEAEIYRLLASLQHKEFLYEQPAFPESEYLFKHALTQDVAYGTVLQEQRKELHEHTAQAIEHRYKDTVEEHYAELAHHYQRSGNTEKAITYLQFAGQQAVQRSANVEAIEHLATALELLKTTPDAPTRAQRELMLQVALGPPLAIAKGFSSPEAKDAYSRARELCRQVGEIHQLGSVLVGLRTFHFVRGEFRIAGELGEQLLELSQKEHDPAVFLEAYRALGTALFHLGNLDVARTYLEQGITLHAAYPRRSRELFIGLRPDVSIFNYAGLLLWHLGYPDQALQKSNAVRTLAQEGTDPFNVAAAQVLAAMTHQLRRESALTQERAEAGALLASEHGFPQWLAQGTVQQGWALTEQGQIHEGIARIRQGLTIHETIETSLLNSYYLTLLAEAQGKAGQVDEGLSALAEALAWVEKNDKRFYEAEVWRIKGELLLMQAEKLSRREIE